MLIPYAEAIACCSDLPGGDAFHAPDDAPSARVHRHAVCEYAVQLQVEVRIFDSCRYAHYCGLLLLMSYPVVCGGRRTTNSA